MPIQYRYALNSSTELVDVERMRPSERREGAPFTCISCSRELVPALGEIQAYHFRHRREQDCSSETYRHQLAKLIFEATYTRCVREGRPFWLLTTTEGTCTFYQERFGFTCRRSEPRRHDLTRWFERISVEAVREEFRADVLLWSEAHEDSVFVEMAVTHPCEAEKRESGHRIIEIAIQTEKDAVALADATVDAADRRVRLYNFRKDRAPVSCDGQCSRPISFFVVYPNGAAALRQAPAAEAAAPRFLEAVPHLEVVPEDALKKEDGWRVFRQKVREAHFAGVPVRHCFLCRYHGADRYGEGIRCKAKRRSCEVNEAVGCTMFKPLPTPEACDQADAANDEYLRTWKEKRGARREERRLTSGAVGRVIHDPPAPALHDPPALAHLPSRIHEGGGTIHWAGSPLFELLRGRGAPGGPAGDASARASGGLLPPGRAMGPPDRVASHVGERDGVVRLAAEVRISGSLRAHRGPQLGGPGQGSLPGL